MLRSKVNSLGNPCTWSYVKFYVHYVYSKIIKMGIFYRVIQKIQTGGIFETRLISSLTRQHAVDKRSKVNSNKIKMKTEKIL